MDTIKIEKLTDLLKRLNTENISEQLKKEALDIVLIIRGC